MGNFCPPGSGSRSTDLIESGSETLASGYVGGYARRQVCGIGDAREGMHSQAVRRVCGSAGRGVGGLKYLFKDSHVSQMVLITGHPARGLNRLLQYLVCTSKKNIYTGCEVY